jgi:hypothetical protein
VLAIAREPQSERAWRAGGHGEQVIGSSLEGLASDSVLVLHDRKFRDESGRLTRRDIDHLVIARKGVWVVDAKACDGQLEVRRAGGLFGPRVEELWVAGRNRTKLVHGVKEQADAVRSELVTVGADVDVHVAMALVGTNLPWFGSSSCGGVHMRSRRGLAKRFQPGPLSGEELTTLRDWLAQRFPAAA